MDPRLRPAQPEDIAAVRALFREYQRWLGVDLCFQSFEAEVAALPGAYAPPSGCLLVADLGAGPAGCVAMRRLGDGICEMKRLWLRPEAQGAGLGRALVDAVLGEARAAGYHTMRLDTLPDRMPAANALYLRAGFRETAPYYHNPVAGTRYLALDLTARR
jgi:ribosomal protein S18 acetylase RimI-like enzyme